MGRTPKPLRILILDKLAEWNEFTTLIEQGHTIHIQRYVPSATPWVDYDIILGKNCWMMDESHRKYLNLAIAEARRRRYPKDD